MKILCLGGAGNICREAVLDLVQTSDFERITVADVNVEAGHRVVEWLDDPRVDFMQVDANEFDETVLAMQPYDLVMDGTPISMNNRSTACIAEAGAHGINLNGMNNEWDFHEIFVANKRVCVPGFGMTPGITNMMARWAADQMESVDTIRISHGAFRPIAFSPAIAETTVVEYDPGLTTRVVFEDGKFVQVPPFARPLEVALPEPYGTHTQYIIPHPETVTLAESMANKGVRLIEVRGTWPPRNMQLLHVLYDWGFLRNERISIAGVEFGIMDAITQYLLQSPMGRQTELYGYALHVDVAGIREGKAVRHILTHTHPPSDGSVEGWEGLRAYTRCVGIPLSIGAQLIASGQVAGIGCLPPERAFDPAVVFAELEKRRIRIHEEIVQNDSREL